MGRLFGIKPEHNFQFTRQWFLNRNLETFRSRVMPVWQGKPITYVELGVFEGLSMVWMRQHVLTHPQSRAIGIDPWLMTRKLSGEYMEAVRARAEHNLRIYPNCKLIRGNSAEVLRRMYRGFEGIKRRRIDVCLIDGGHYELLVLDDARNCLELVKPGGWIIFDDVVNDKTKSAHVRQALDTFLAGAGDRVKFLWKHRYVETYEVVQRSM